MKNSEIVIPSEYESEAVKVAVPLCLIWGTQTPAEYSESRTRSIRNALSEQGTDFYFNNPVIIGLLPYESNSVLFLVNGHHRTREASKYHLHAVPSLVFSHVLLAELANIEEPVYRSLIERWTSGAVHEFEYHYKANRKHYNPPKVLSGLKNLHELQQVSQSETIQGYGVLKNLSNL